MAESSFERIGFLSLNRGESRESYLGALLITDANGIPIEFRVTHPVKPTVIQRSLYGGALEPYIGSVLCGRQLFTASERKPEVIFVNEEFMLGVREEISVPVILVREAGRAIEVPTVPSNNRSLTRIDPIGAFRSLIVSVHGQDAGELGELRVRVERHTANLDFLEPFDRIAEALKVLAKQDKRFS